MNIYNELVLINNLINEKKIDEAINLLENIKTDDSNIILVGYLKRKIEELETLDYEILEDIEYGNFFMNMYEKERGLSNALMYYHNGLRKSGNNIFNYYIGKVHYKRTNYKKALEYFRKYISRGGMKLDKAYLYLSFIYKKSPLLSNMDLSNKYSELSNILFDFNSETLSDQTLKLTKKE